MKFNCSLGLYEGYPSVFVCDVYKGFFLVLPGLFPPSKIFFQVLEPELLNV